MVRTDLPTLSHESTYKNDGFLIDFKFRHGGESLRMRRLSAWMAVGAMLFALVSAPLFHVHDRDDHGNAGSFIHAHFPDVENPTEHSERSVETEHSHQHVRWIDVFTLSTPVPLGLQVVAEFSQPLSIPSPPVSRAVLSLQTLRAHSPPEHFDLPPRSPPTS